MDVVNYAFAENRALHTSSSKHTAAKPTMLIIQQESLHTLSSSDLDTSGRKVSCLQESINLLSRGFRLLEYALSITLSTSIRDDLIVLNYRNGGTQPKILYDQIIPELDHRHRSKWLNPRGNNGIPLPKSVNRLIFFDSYRKGHGSVKCALPLWATNRCQFWSPFAYIKIIFPPSASHSQAVPIFGWDDHRTLKTSSSSVPARSRASDPELDSSKNWENYPGRFLNWDAPHTSPINDAKNSNH